MTRISSIPLVFLIAFPGLTMGCDDGLKVNGDAGSTSDSAVATDGGSGNVDGGSANCFGFSNDPDAPLAFDGAFTETTDKWRRPADVDNACPAAVLLPETQAQPFVMVSFCNEDSVPHAYNIEMLSEVGPAGEMPLQSPFLVVYDGIGIPSDPQACRAMNDTGPEVLDNSSQLLGLQVAAGESITVMGTSFSFAPDSGAGIGGYILVITNADEALTATVE